MLASTVILEIFRKSPMKFPMKFFHEICKTGLKLNFELTIFNLPGNLKNGPR